MGEGMDSYKNLSIAAIALLALAVATLTGLLIVSQYGYVLRTPTPIAITDFNVTLAGDPVVIGATYPFAQTLTGCFWSNDSTTTLAASLYTIDEGTQGVTGADATFTLAAGGGAFNDTNINCSAMTYLATSDASDSADLFSTGLAIFATFAAVIALAIIGKIIVNIFRKK